ncbi:MAG TPA: hypothetical protein VFW53_10045 [Gallionella sp.]|nr:hypothetical protein [Gallionella sp.]
MVELLLLVIIIALVVLTIRGGKRGTPDAPLVILSPGQYHLTLAPQLERAQAFIASIAAQFSGTYQPRGDIPTQYFEVRDPQVFAPREKCYLLAATRRGGMLYFQAINPPSRGARYHALREFSDAVLVHHPLAGELDVQGEQALREAVDAAATRLEIVSKTLPEND